jgi:hypothetical protein
MITSLSKLLRKIDAWISKAIPDKRIDNDSDGRGWFLKSIDYSDTLKTSDLRDFVDRSDLNDSFNERYEDTNTQSRKGISALKVEISALYSFNKCFVQRYKGRIHYYRDDLSQKWVRNMYAVAQSYALFEELKKNLD